MGRYAGPVCRTCRREGLKLFLKGRRCETAKCALDRRPDGPGMHGGRRGVRKLSSYGLQLREKQRLRRQYGLQEEQFRHFFARALKARGVTGERLLQMLETRLDSIVFRMGFAPSLRAARQFVLHKHVLVDGRRASIPSMLIKTGTTVQVKDNPRSRQAAKGWMDSIGDRMPPSWLSVDKANFSGVVLHVPSRDEIGPVVDEQLVVELYSK